MTSRIPVTPETHHKIKGYAEGLSASFDDALNYLLECKIGLEKSTWNAGDKDRRDFKEWLEKKGTDAKE